MFASRLIVFTIVLLSLAACALAEELPGSNQPPSILFVNVDDLNDWNEVLGGHPQAITPNIKRLAERGVTFTRAVCPSPVCFPSRTAVFSGIHPVNSGAISNFNWGKPWRFYVGDAVTLPKHLEQHGYTTFAGGKNFHDRDAPEFGTYFRRPGEPKRVAGSGYFAGPLGWAIADVPYEEMPDHQVVSWGIEQLSAVDPDRPVFASVGIYRPHVPWILPQSSFDKYPLESFKLSERRRDDLTDLPKRLQLLAHNEAKFGTGFHEELERNEQVRPWARAYLASVTFADEQVGRLLDAWDQDPRSKDGVIVLWSDHGFMLGEKQGWGKFKPWYDACHSNLIVVAPGLEPGSVCDKAVSLLDLYPTLLAFAGLDHPDAQPLDGVSLMPLLRDPDAAWDRPVVMSHEEDGVRYDVVLDDRYRLTRLITGETELYDHATDEHEWQNLAGDPAYAETIERLSSHLTFEYPAFPDDGWLEAEDLPTQTSADHTRRGNFHYRLAREGASGERMVYAELRKGPKSYIDFVVRVDRPGSYAVAARVQHTEKHLDISVAVDDVRDDAGQATAEHPMRVLDQRISGSDAKPWTFEQVELGTARFDTPGLKIIRFMTEGDDPIQLRIDRLRVHRLADE